MSNSEAESMVERVARAMQASKAWPVVFDAGSAQVLARAAIEAMMEPTEAMYLACWPLHHPWGQNAPEPSERQSFYDETKAKVKRDWQAMLRSTLTT